LNGGLGTEVENDIVFENISLSILAPGCKSSGMLHDLGHVAALKYRDTPFLIEDKRVDPSIFSA
jgi:hypothetical protein